MVLGITGGIACGKSTVTALFGKLGAVVVSADQLAREAVVPGSATLQALTERFGRSILLPDGTLDRAALAARVFSDPQARADLNRITHPAIAALAEERLATLRDRRPSLVVYEAPLLFEAGAERRVDAVLVVSAGEEQQMARLMARDGLSEGEARARIAAQLPLAEKVRRVDFVIDNSGPEEATARQVRELFTRLTVPPPDAPGNGG